MDISVTDLNAALRDHPNEGESPIVEALREIGAIQETRSTYDQVVPVKLDGFFEQRWMTPMVGAVQNNESCRVRSIFEVILAGLTMPRTSLGRIAESLTHHRTLLEAAAVRNESDFEQINSLMRSLNEAFIWDFSGNKCLTYSYALVRLARGRGIPAKLMIGVRTRPFFSHAWVELHKQVVSDTPTLKQSLAVIMEV
ncbi:lasso peptide biosynthesis B2 protein [Cupriavidus sp. PET2-C1]